MIIELSSHYFFQTSYLITFFNELLYRYNINIIERNEEYLQFLPKP